MNSVFRDRVEAGQMLAKRLPSYARRDDVIVLALPRGGVPIGFEVACALRAPLDVLLVRRLGVPGREDLAMGAIAIDGTQLLDQSAIRSHYVRAMEIDAVASRDQFDLARRNTMYRGERSRPKLEDMIVLLVDDGIGTGATMRVAIEMLRQARPRSIVAAAPVAANAAVDRLRQYANEVVTVLTPADLGSIAQYYGDFAPTSDDEVIALLTRAAVRFSTPDRGSRELTCFPLPRSPYLGLANHRLPEQVLPGQTIETTRPPH